MRAAEAEPAAAEVEAAQALATAAHAAAVEAAEEAAAFRESRAAEEAAAEEAAENALAELHSPEEAAAEVHSLEEVEDSLEEAAAEPAAEEVEETCWSGRAGGGGCKDFWTMFLFLWQHSSEDREDLLERQNRPRKRSRSPILRRDRRSSVERIRRVRANRFRAAKY